MSIKSKKRQIKRYTYTKNPTAQNPRRDVDSDSSGAECNETAVVRCNQWECFTRYLCKD